MAEIKGADLLAKSLKEQGVQFMFGVVGFPVGPLAEAAQKVGLPYIGMRNEQTASYAAGAVGYLTGRPGSCIVVTGPGVIHGLAGLANAQQNCWPMLLIGGASETYRNGMGAFQEERQVLAATPLCKWAHGIEHVHRIPFYVEMAVRQSIYGRPGAAYLDLPDDIITGSCDADKAIQAAKCPDPPRTQTMPEYIEKALDVLQSAERPLVIIGKGMAFSRAEDEVRAFIERTQVPFLASPMGKGVMPDDHPLSVGAARSLALQQADVVFLMGSRFNWIMHFGLPPRYNKDVRVIQLDIEPEAMHQNKSAEVALVGDGKAIVGQLNQGLTQRQWFYPKETPWRAAITKKSAENAALIAPQIADDSAPGGYYRLLRDVAAWTPKNAIVCSEGASTMDIGRTQLPNFLPRSRLDAGSYGTMGVGLGIVIAACVVHPDRPIVHVSGDSAIGFSGMEMETLCRYGMPAKIVVFNNGGIGPGMPEIPQNPMLNMRPNSPKDLRGALDEAMNFKGPALVNVKLSQGSQRKAQEFRWHS
jgi:2-hydroxyacyl-CoA lyase 1